MPWSMYILLGHAGLVNIGQQWLTLKYMHTYDSCGWVTTETLTIDVTRATFSVFDQHWSQLECNLSFYPDCIQLNAQEWTCPLDFCCDITEDSGNLKFFFNCFLWCLKFSDVYIFFYFNSAVAFSRNDQKHICWHGKCGVVHFLWTNL